jgi:hypothetical protein
MASARDRRREQRHVLDDLLGGPEVAPASPPPPASPPAEATEPAPESRNRQASVPARAGTARLSVRLPGEIVERTRDAVFHSPGLTLTSLLAEALAREIERLETERGEGFPRRTGRVRTGRPLR